MNYLDESKQSRLERLKERIDLAAGRRPVEKILTNCHVVNVFNGSILETNIAVSAGKIIGLGDYVGEEVVDLGGAYVVPGLIDAHVHMESSLVTPEQLDRIVVPRGTTTMIADPHEIANVCGLDGIRYMIAAARNAKLNGFFMLSSCVPATPTEHAGAVLNAAALGTLLDQREVLGLGELMNYPGVINADPDMLEKIDLCLYKIIDGHGPGLTGKELNAYVINGIRTEHECTTLAEMDERLGLGMYIAIREGSAAKNLDVLIKGVNAKTKDRCMFCTDDKHPEDILAEGHIDYNVRRAIALGTDPIVAIQMATINPATCYGLRDIGAIAPGYDADLVVVDDLEAFNVRRVYKKGELVAENHQALFATTATSDLAVINTVKLAPIVPEQLRLPLSSDVVHVIRVLPGSIVTEKVVRRVYQDQAGDFVANPRIDVVKIAVLARHGRGQHIGIGLVENFGLKNGAIASSIAHDSHNIIVVGDSDRDMALAVNELIRLQGGIAVVAQGSVAGSLGLPIGGLMSAAPMEEVAASLRQLRQIAHESLQVLPDIEPFMTLSFLALPVIPQLKITDQGYFDVATFQPIAVEA